jgi:hypothetical protein
MQKGGGWKLKSLGLKVAQAFLDFKIKFSWGSARMVNPVLGHLTGIPMLKFGIKTL